MDSSAQSSQNGQPVSPLQPVSGGGGVAGKEIETVGVGKVEVPAIKEVRQEIELPPEVTSVGVKIRPTTVQFPKPVAQMGVKPAGQAAPLPAISVSLPLTDDQIVQGLHQSLTSSWRWLAEWCVRKLKQLHRKLVKS